MDNHELQQYHTFFTKPLFAMGPSIPGECDRRINEAATRARAGLLNILSMITMVILIFKPELDPILYVGPYVIFDMTVAALFGLTPLTPTGLLGTAITMKFPATWKPIKPKRFAWTLGAVLGVTCFGLRLLGAPNEAIIAVLGTCFLLTWLEAVLGFCVGCWMHSLFFGCEVCKLSK
ncbi:MAG: DUF4395 domain-containing protein [Fibrobacterales bacterium]